VSQSAGVVGREAHEVRRRVRSERRALAETRGRGGRRVVVRNLVLLIKNLLVILDITKDKGKILE